MPRDEDSSYNYIDFAELARLLAQAAVATPAVVQAPANTAPSAPAVEQAVTQIAQAVVPVIAPKVPRQAIKELAWQIANEVVTTPEIIKADTGVSVPPKVIDSIVSEVSDVIPQDVIDSIEKSLSNASAEQVVVPTPSQALDERSQAISEYKNFFGTGQGTSGTDGAINGGAKDDGGGTGQTSASANLENTSVSEADISKIMQNAGNAAAEEVVALEPTASQITKSINDMTQEEIDAFTKATVATGGKSTDPANRLKDESASAANARITEGYKKFLAKPVPTAAQIAAGMKVQYVRSEAGGVGFYTTTVPWDYKGDRTVTQWTEGIIPVNSKYTTGSDVGKFVDAEGNVTPVPSISDIINQGGGVIGETYTPTPTATPTAPTGPIVTPTGFPSFGTDKDTKDSKDSTTAVTSAVTSSAVTSAVTSSAVTSAVTSSVSSVGLNNETKLLIQSLQNQIATLTNQQTAAANIAAANTASVAETQRQSIIATLTDRFAKYGLTSLANKVRELAIDGATEATITLALQETPEYQQRFAANAERLKKNLQVLSPAEYINLEDSYRQVLRAYGLRQFDTDEYVRQFIANDMSAAELSDRVVTAVQRVQNADPATAKTLRDYYGIGNADLVAYVLDPNQQLQKIQRQVAAAEIGTAARLQGLEAGVSVSEQLAAQGITQAQAQKGYATIADILPTAEKLSQIYGGTLSAYGQTEAEQEVFNSLADAQKKRERLVARELAAFSGQSGLSRNALTQPTQGQF